MLRGASLDFIKKASMLSSYQIAQDFNLNNPQDLDLEVSGYGSKLKKGAKLISWAKNADFLSQVSQGTVVCKEYDFNSLSSPRAELCYLTTESNPRLLFAKILSKYFTPPVTQDIKNDVERHRQNPGLQIADNVFIAENVTIGDGTIIHSGVVIHAHTSIGINCVLKANASIATEGLGLELDPETQLLTKFPQLGGVILEDYVEIGPSSTIRRSALDDTIIGRGTKIGALCNIGHNTIIGQNCIFACNNITSGSSVVGDEVFLGVGAMIKVGVTIGSKVTLGMGAIVTKNVPDNETWVGNPARKIPTP